jgi:tetratricopeptide (TPR) repeat protein
MIPLTRLGVLWDTSFPSIVIADLMSRAHSIRANFAAVIFCTASLLCVDITRAAGQQNPIRTDPGVIRTYYETAPGTSVLIFNVFAENGRTHLDRQALLTLANPVAKTAIWETTDDTSKAVFSNVPYGSYDVEVSAVGYLSEHKQLQAMSFYRPSEMDIVLHRDPAAINLDVSASIMSPKARKQTKRAISALKSGNLKEAERQLDEAYKSTPASPDLNFLLGYFYFQKKDYARAGSYLSTATTLSPGNVQALTLLGRAGLEQQNYPLARSALEQVVAADAENWLPHNLLADAYLRQQNYTKARDEAESAINKGKSAASPAQLVLGQALLGLGRDEEGIEALNVFLQASPRHPIAVQVRRLIAEIKERETSPVPAQNAARTEGKPEAKTEAKIAGVDPLLALPGPGLTVRPWRPAGIDELRPSVAAGVVCPSEKVIEESGKRVQELSEDVSRFAAVEDMLHQRLDEFGNPTRTETRKFNYIASISEPEPGVIAVNESRADKMDLAGYPDQIASTGFAALALVFHPHMRDTFQISCEGLGDWRGQATWVLRFRQRDDRPARMHSYKVGTQVHPVELKGRAWITADNFQIVRIESELVKPMPEIQLLSEHQVVEYGPIPFAKKNTSLWLPKSAEIYFDFRKRRYYRRHSFDRYMLFSIESEEKYKLPEVKPKPGDKTTTPEAPSSVSPGSSATRLGDGKMQP